MDTGIGNHTSYRLLLVEDDAVIAAGMKRHLEKWGYNVICAEDFSNIVKTFAACSPHLVLMDIGLPFYNGYYWCAQIRQISKVPIIFVSSASDNMNIVMAVNMGGDDFVTKPFEPEVLSAKVQAMLRRAYAFREPTSIMECRSLTGRGLFVVSFPRSCRRFPPALRSRACPIMFMPNRNRLNPPISVSILKISIIFLPFPSFFYGIYFIKCTANLLSRFCKVLVKFWF